LVIAGDGPDKKRIKELIKKLSLEKCVRLTGFADEKMKLDLFSKAAFVVFPSRNEGFSLVSLEAIASGHRLVAFDIPSLDWAKEKVIRRIKGFNTDEYSKALLKEAKYKPKFNSEKICREYVKKYSWEKVTDKFEMFFEEIVKGERHEK
jgi:glycosyltransferase involved in cell wall biosynthesis